MSIGMHYHYLPLIDVNIDSSVHACLPEVYIRLSG